MKEFFARGMIMLGLAAGLFCGKAMADEPVQVAKGKIAVVYYSWSPDGNTRFAAETLAKKLSARLFEIKAEKPYSTDFRTCCKESKTECKSKLIRQILPVNGFNALDYDAVLIGTPNWWGTMAPPVRTFVSQNARAFKGKTVCIFATHGSGGLQRIGKEFAELVFGAKVLPPCALPGAEVRKRKAELEEYASKYFIVK